MSIKWLLTLASLTIGHINILAQIEQTLATPAEYPGGGLQSFFSYVEQNMKYPPVALDSGITGKVYVQFVVDSTGLVEEGSIIVINDAPEILHSEAIRLIAESGKWIPPKDENGKVTGRIMTLPITFRKPNANPSDQEKGKKKRKKKNK